MLSKAFFVRSFKSYTVLKPFIDFEYRLSNVQSIKTNIKRRKLDVNIEEISAFYKNLKGLEKVKSDLEDSREVVREKLSKLGSANDETEERKLKMTAKILREDHKQIKSAVMDLEQNLANLMVKVPNELSSRTPDEDEIVSEKVILNSAQGSHAEIGEALDILEVKSPWGIFLKDEAAFIELEMVRKLKLELSKQGFFGFSNPDSVREIVTDGCAGIYSSSIPLSSCEHDDDVSYLTGGAAPEPFFAFFAKNSFKKSDLPLRCYANGRQYAPGTADFGLFEPPQTNAVQIFVAVPPALENQEIDDIVAVLTNFYENFNVPFRVVLKCASHLSVAESLRFSFEVFSPHFNKYFEAGHVSLYGDHLSKNMNIHVSSGAKTEFARIISGTVLRVGPMLAGILEAEGDLKSMDYVH